MEDNAALGGLADRLAQLEVHDGPFLVAAWTAFLLTQGAIVFLAGVEDEDIKARPQFVELLDQVADLPALDDRLLPQGATVRFFAGIKDNDTKPRSQLA